MENENKPKTSQRPPRPPVLPLGWRVALSTALIIGVVMGGLSINQQAIELKTQQEARRELLSMSLAPLADRLEKAPSLSEMQREIDEFEAAFRNKGYPVHDVLIIDASNRRVLSKDSANSPDPADEHFRATTPVVSALIAGGAGTLMVLQDDRFRDESEDASRMLWLAHFIATVGAVCLFLTLAIYYQVTRPISRLLKGVRKLEMGYWGDLDISGGAWEIRWLTWRFSNMIHEVQTSMTRLFEAERMARTLVVERNGQSTSVEISPSTESGVSKSVAADSPVYRELCCPYVNGWKARQFRTKRRCNSRTRSGRSMQSWRIAMDFTI
jgi:hypothetical protein